MVSNSPADRAGVRPGDIVISGDGEALTDVKHLQSMMTGDKINAEFELRVIRGDEVETLTTRPVELTE